MEKSLREDHFEENTDGGVAPQSRKVAASFRNPDQVLNAEDVDEEMFIFPDRKKDQEEEQAPEEESKQNQLLSTTDLI